MKYSTYVCLICNKDKLENEVLLIKLNFRKNPPQIQEIVQEEYCGIRIICKSCIDGIVRLNDQNSLTAIK